MATLWLALREVSPEHPGENHHQQQAAMITNHSGGVSETGAVGRAAGVVRVTVSVRVMERPAASVTVMVKVFVPTIKFTVLLELPP